MNDPADEELGLASPTLAQLYLAQGHAGHARSTCKEVLDQDPSNGYALALLERLRPSVSARVGVRFVASSTTGIDLGAGQLELSWDAPPSLLDAYEDPRLDVVFAIAALRDAHGPAATALRYSSVRCLDASGSRRLDAPLGPASAAVMLVLSPGPRRPPSLLTGPQPRPAPRVLAVADPLSW